MNYQIQGSDPTIDQPQAAALYPQLLDREAVILKRLAIHAAYDQALSAAARSGRIQTMSIPDGCRVNGLFFFAKEVTHNHIARPGN